MIFNFFRGIIKSIYYQIFRYKRHPRRYRYLFDLIKDIKPRNILEIGVWNGRRGVEMIRLAQKFQSEPINYFGADLFEKMNEKMLVDEFSKMPPSEEEVKNRLDKTGAKITLIKGNTTESLPRNFDLLPPMDFVFIDGGHAVETITNDWFYVSQLLSDKGVVVFDDYYPDRDDVGAKKVVENINLDKYQVKILPIQDVFKKTEGLLKINFVEVRKK